MKKQTLITALGMTVSLGFAQTHDHSEHIVPENPAFCGQVEETEKVFSANPEWAESHAIEQENFQVEYENFLETWSPDDRSSYVVPMVVHVVHLGGSENISDEQIYNAIEYLNLDFNMTNPDVGFTIPEFADITGNCDIEFRLATKGPDGQCHPGITRTYSETTYDTGMTGGGHPIVEAVRDEHGNWPQNKYMNVFVCIDPSGAAGYTFNPGNWYPAGGMYGSIFMRHDYMGVIGTGSSTAKHTLSHEVGHWLNLSHCWGGSNSPTLASNCGSDDGVGDTPNTRGWNNCSDLYGETCGSLDNVQNIMEYSYCSTMFTEGQAARVQTSLLGGTAQRYKLSEPSNLVATGTDGPGDLCEANFTSDTRSVCAGATVTFTDLSFHTVTTRAWEFDGGSPASSSAENPTITYNTPGIYSVTLNASNGGDSESKTEEAYIIVLPSTGDGMPYGEGFETLTSVPDNERFLVDDVVGDGTWQLTSDAAYSGSESVYISNYNKDAGTKDELISSTIDLSGVSPSDDVIFTFKYAYNKRNADNDEWLRVYASKDCGETWVLRKNIHGDALGETVSGSPYAPEGEDEWTEVSITNILPDYYVSNFRFKIEFEGDGGNNIYIDDINLFPESMLSIESETAESEISVYPNPMGDQTTVTLNVAETKDYTVTVHNALGEEVAMVFNGTVQAGTTTLQYDSGDLAKGVYILRIASGEETKTIKVVKN